MEDPEEFPIPNNNPSAGSRPHSRTGSASFRDAAATGVLPPLSRQGSVSALQMNINNNNNNNNNKFDPAAPSSIPAASSTFGRLAAHSSLTQPTLPNFDDTTPPRDDDNSKNNYNNISTIPQSSSEQALSEMIAGGAAGGKNYSTLIANNSNSNNNNNNNPGTAVVGQTPSQALPPQLLPAFFDSAPADSVNTDKVLWFGNVDKVGKGLGAHRRAAFVTSSGIILALPTGGVTRVIPLEALGSAAIIPPNIVNFEEPGKHDLVLCCPDQSQRDALAEAAVFARRQKLGPAVPPLEVKRQDSLVLDPSGIPHGHPSAKYRADGGVGGGRGGEENDNYNNNYNYAGNVAPSAGLGLPVNANSYGQQFSSNNDNNIPSNNQQQMLPKQYPELTSNLANLISQIGGPGSHNLPQLPSSSSANPAFHIPNFNEMYSGPQFQQQPQQRFSDSNSPSRQHQSTPPPPAPSAPTTSYQSYNPAQLHQQQQQQHQRQQVQPPPTISSLSASSLFPAAYYQPQPQQNSHNNNNSNPPPHPILPSTATTKSDLELAHLYPPPAAAVQQPQHQQHQQPSSSASGAFSSAIDQLNQGYYNTQPPPTSLEIARGANQHGGSTSSSHVSPHRSSSQQQQQQQQQQFDENSAAPPPPPLPPPVTGITPSFSPASPVPGTSRNLLEATAHAVALTEHTRQAERLQNLEEQFLNQNRLLEAMRQQSEHKQLTGLKDELSHARNLIADLQAALKSQENTFAEMLRSQELLKASEEARSQQERELQFLRQDRDNFGRQLREKENALLDMREAMQRVENKGHAELERLRQAFVDYDKSVGEYVEKQRLQHLEELEALRKRLIAEQEVNYQNRASKEPARRPATTAATTAAATTASPGTASGDPALSSRKRLIQDPQVHQPTQQQQPHSQPQPISSASVTNSSNNTNNKNDLTDDRNSKLDPDQLRNALLDLAGGIGPSGLDKLQRQVNQYHDDNYNRSQYNNNNDNNSSNKPSFFHPTSPYNNNNNNYDSRLGLNDDSPSTSATMFAPHHHLREDGDGYVGSLNQNYQQQQQQQKRPLFNALSGPAASTTPTYTSHALDAARQHLAAFGHGVGTASVAPSNPIDRNDNYYNDNNNNSNLNRTPSFSRRDRSIL